MGSFKGVAKSFLTLVNLFQMQTDTLSDDKENVVDDLDGKSCN